MMSKPSIYQKKLRWKLGLLVFAVLIGVASLMVTGRLVKSLAEEERKKMELWAEATREIADIESEISDYTLILKVIQYNETVPVIVVDDAGEVLDHRNLNPSRSDNPEYLRRQLEAMKKKNEPIEIEFFDDTRQFIHYNDSRLLVWLLYYPYIQLLVILLYLLTAYYAFSISRKAEQNQVWLGMSKETAHQLGTPTSSLIAMLELMKDKNYDRLLLDELEKDINRLEKITERFSKIGSRPALKNDNIANVIENSLEYLRSRTPRRIVFVKDFRIPPEMAVPVNVSLFGWVIENVCKNALDAMEGAGELRVSVTDQAQTIFVDIGDTGRGIPRNLFKTIFKPGYSTRRNGWGLGLSLSKRIIEEYHGGRIFVYQSALNAGTTIRIVLNKPAK